MDGGRRSSRTHRRNERRKESGHLVAKETCTEGAVCRRPKKTRSRKAGQPYLTLPSSRGRCVRGSIVSS
uniref:Uncharacterized protein n=1 Tax=Rangifer tarandus platyrhynchus TaxID=3082113 RepID=A0ACB0FLL6_RANTA|nr:unnamed protein product [Rangifer tarandus platyrhynchus]